MGSDGRKWVWKKPGESLSDRLVEETQKFGGGSLMMWGCMRRDGLILEDELQNSLENWGKTVEDVVFQQDNDPKHTSKKAKDWFKDHDFNTIL
ncbi:uncharacterized protein LAESUDRAFT_659829 [Laetiporus sulphureus 93-53]|uniref:Tc1-like transposase DDE domain-containing protein n=1 Tax=Laetiporus sulphureus 93-53 TaxID=1314785 RepID=A0A165CTL5_9APHY|nr:uncharacterized protein LAESUDRAFT_659829 [Laetiporus sulphureus 93-53]KZT03414.1 hypothetical protein LAESUDRAFT_659829 [Laetiporus sulphureus 93-53]